jgi:hypothetical protein
VPREAKCAFSKQVAVEYFRQMTPFKQRDENVTLTQKRMSDAKYYEEKRCNCEEDIHSDISFFLICAYARRV